MSYRFVCFSPASALLFFLFPFITASAYELSGKVALEGRYFFHSPSYTEQEHHNVSLGISGELYHELESGSSVTIEPFFRLDSADSQRTHADLREFNYVHLADLWEVKVGLSKVFWGATEFVHLVDIINQTDLVEDIYGEEKLGQPMIHLSLAREWGTLDGFMLPYFRERTFPGENGRLRSAKVVDTDKAMYESSAGQTHTDFALRYSHSIGNVDLGVYQFVGTGREPSLLEKQEVSGSTVLVPYYPQISQAGLDVQLVQGEWLWKGELLYRTGQGRAFAAVTYGLEYTVYNVFDSQIDAGLIVEYVFDDRDESIATVYDNDIMTGLRLSFNDMEGTEMLAGVIKDINNSSSIISIEASRRFGEFVKIYVTGGLFSDMSDHDPGYDLHNDDYLQVEAVYFF